MLRHSVAELGQRDSEVLAAEVHPVDPLVVEVLVQRSLERGGVLGVDHRVHIEPEGHRRVAQFVHAVERL